MSLHSMKLPKKRSSHNDGAAISSHNDNDGPRFPFGLEISLDDDSLKMLNFDGLPAVGTEMIVVGVGRVTRASESRNQRGVNRNVSIQLESVEIEPFDDGTPASASDAVTKAIKDV